MTATIPSSPPVLSAWQATQAAMLYHYSSLAYLQRLRLALADAAEGRFDTMMALKPAGPVSPMFKDREPDFGCLTSNGRIILRGLAGIFAQDVQRRLAGRMYRTGMGEFERTLENYGAEPWGDPAETLVLEYVLALAARLASPIDSVYFTGQNRWCDFSFAHTLPQFQMIKAAPLRFVVHPEVCAGSGELAPRTGVYMCADDPLASLQYGWTANGGMCLRDACSFSDVGLAALASVGRDGLWSDDAAMLAFVTSPRFQTQRDAMMLDGWEPPTLETARYFISYFAKITKPGHWMLVEAVAVETPGRDVRPAQST